MRTILTLAVLAALALTAGCNIGNKSGECATGDTCTCNGIGNCTYDCPSGKCHFVCTGIGNCNFSCEGGGCDFLCKNTGNCIATCSDKTCTNSCQGTGNCTLTCVGTSCGLADAGH